MQDFGYDPEDVRGLGAIREADEFSEYSEYEARR